MSPEKLHASMGETRQFTVFLSLEQDSQKGLRHGSRKPMNPLAQNFGFQWFARVYLSSRTG
jgi:hypothetical protein